MAYLSDKITDIGQPSELSIFTVAPNQVAIEKNIFWSADLSLPIIQRTHQSKYPSQAKETNISIYGEVDYT